MSIAKGNKNALAQFWKETMHFITLKHSYILTCLFAVNISALWYTDKLVIMPSKLPIL